LLYQLGIGIVGIGIGIDDGGSPLLAAVADAATLTEYPLSDPSRLQHLSMLNRTDGFLKLQNDATVIM